MRREKKVHYCNVRWGFIKCSVSTKIGRRCGDWKKVTCVRCLYIKLLGDIKKLRGKPIILQPTKEN